jgi:hypothetical protein
VTSSNLKPWPKGVSGNPAGLQARLPAEVRAERRKNQAALILLVSKLFAANRKAKGKTELERAVQGMIDRAKKGDTNAFKYLIELICGKIPEQDPETLAEQMTPEQKLELMKQAVAALEAQVKPDGSGSAQ